MKTKKSQDNTKKKKKITVILVLMAMILMTVIGFIGGTLVLKVMEKNNEPQKGNVNTIYIDEKIARRGGK